MDRIGLDDRRIATGDPVQSSDGAFADCATPPYSQHPLLRPNLWLSLDDIEARPASLPQQPGAYGWWFQTLPPEITDEGTAKGPFGALLYVGIAPNGPASRRTLRDRIHEHIKGPIGSSTLRRTLSVLLAEQLKLRLLRSPSNRLCMSADDEARLTDWMRSTARVAWVVCDKPWHLEKTLIANGPRLPLNIRGSTDPAAKRISAMRSTAAC